VFGGAIKAALPPRVHYIDFLMPGIVVQTVVFGSTQTGVGLAETAEFKILPHGSRWLGICSLWVGRRESRRWKES